jgi:hypothetical protein
MKTTWKLISAIAIVVFVASCVQQVDPTPKFAASNTDFSITASSAAVTVAAKDSLASALTVNWNDPKYSVGLKKSKFTVMVGKSGGNFTSFSSKEFSNALTGSLTGKELNGMALKFGGLVGQPIALDLMVVASQENNNEPKKSNVVQVSITAFSGFQLIPSPTSIVTNPATPSANGTTFNWNNGFSGFSGVITYQLQYAKAGTSFAAPTLVTVTGFSKSFTHLELNSIALGYNITPSTIGNVDFRVKATNELGVITYSSVATVAITPYIAINAVGIIGDATPGSWNVDTDLYRPDASKPSEWTTIVYLIGGKEAKFRTDDDWATNWGSASFPSGTGVPGGSNIPINASGYYKVDFNAATRVYTFTLKTTPSLSSMSIIGSGTPGGWNADTNLTQDATNANIFTGTVVFTDGEAKFRKTGDWGTNWGAATYPSGWGVPDGANIPVKAGTYFVRIDIATGEYAFGPANRSTPFADIGVIGDSTPNGWGSDTDLIKNPANPFKWSKKLTLTAGEAKFRADNDWATNWGDAPFPGGVGTQDGSNIKNVTSGTYQITFNTLTGEYTFTK